MVRRVHCTLIVCVATVLVPTLPVRAQPPDAPARPCVVITADPELDDTNTLIRAFLYTSDFTIEGLVYASSVTRYQRVVVMVRP